MIAAAVVAGVSGCAQLDPKHEVPISVPISHAAPSHHDDIAPLSAVTTSDGLPPHWETYLVTRNKRLTAYEQMADSDGIAVIRARVDGSASGIAQKLDIPVYAGTKLAWRWRADALPADADIRTKRFDDAPVRIALAFDGDSGKLTVQDHLHRELARLVSGRDLPYATLIYTWGDGKFAKDEIIANPYTGRIRSVVVERGEANLGKWLVYSRDIASDYERAFGEPPGRLIGIAIMSDGDNTQSKYTAWYGDIRLDTDAIPTTTAAK
ncbi:DUF3047 domain-containing protein [Pandoraea nosoerga]|uniref:DUF3047 domain-containing protein n=1 Tax=Pandoraea nosoerga TaxID=2508296 RepID=A0A5E4XP71_9BURK|nr:DUF3047 domain-containing protein [Pandoraea nosoerga]MBN4664050.1 DUF3047 domain-containing protein [Pandoraea nosoerga]MBN4675538.1 DUF3047 domain-containing protein [Pandoraea nosoerga]MBN4679139.1 DUF3047 domain-containing protein [Pandoraea nosoerga]MBN4743862.1 DUF3047 domain-containing protein [Pandoraea nosoerga]VVE38086.1 hypothetical protein PNO31109_04006 [Pandoraea nosoerga]